MGGMRGKAWWGVPLVGLLAACAGAPVARQAEPDEAAANEPRLAASAQAHAQVREAFVSAALPQANLDSPASWTAPDGRRWVIVTGKKSNTLEVFDGDDGRHLRSVGGKVRALGQLDRPNGIAVVGDLALVVERDNHRVQVFALPAFTPLLAFGEADLRKPYGLWARRDGDALEVIVSDNYMLGADEETVPPLAELGQRFRRYRLQQEGDGRWQARLQQTFGETTPAGAVRIAESVWADPDNDRLLLAEEDVATGTRLREYRLSDARYAGRDVGADRFRAQAEGIALLACADGSGYWIASDQYKDRTLFHVFDRRSLAPLGAFAGAVTANTDGIWMEPRGDARFPEGVLYAVHDDMALAAFDWRDIARALKLPQCRR